MRWNFKKINWIKQNFISRIIPCSSLALKSAGKEKHIFFAENINVNADQSRQNSCGLLTVWNEHVLLLLLSLLGWCFVDQDSSIFDSFKNISILEMNICRILNLATPLFNDWEISEDGK